MENMLRCHWKSSFFSPKRNQPRPIRLAPHPSLIPPCIYKLLAILFLYIALNQSAKCLAQEPGFPNIPQRKGALVSGGKFATNGGRTAVIGYQQGYLFINFEAPGSRDGSDCRNRFFDISTPTNIKEAFFEGSCNSTFAAHGYYHEAGGGLVLYPNSNYLFRNGVFASRPAPEFYFKANNDWHGRGLLHQPFHMTMFWSYGETNRNAELYKRDAKIAEWNIIGQTGVIGHPILVGNILFYASDQSMTGIAAYDISPSLANPGTPPRLIGLYRGKVGGYWPELWGGNGKLRIIFPNSGDGVQVVDVTNVLTGQNSGAMSLVLDLPIPSATSWQFAADPSYAQFQDNFAFTDRFKIDMLSLRAEQVIDPVPAGLQVGQFGLPIGNLLVTGGIFFGSEMDQGAGIWAHQAEPDLRGPSVGFHIPVAGQINYPVGAPITLLIHETLEPTTIINGSTFTLRPVASTGTVGAPLPGRLIFTFSDQLQFTPDSDLAPNTTYEVEVTANGIKDAAGNGISGYKFRFATGGSLIAGSASSTTPGASTSPSPSAVGVSTAGTCLISMSTQARRVLGTLALVLDKARRTGDTRWLPIVSRLNTLLSRYQVSDRFVVGNGSIVVTCQATLSSSPRSVREQRRLLRRIKAIAQGKSH